MIQPAGQRYAGKDAALRLRESGSRRFAQVGKTTLVRLLLATLVLGLLSMACGGGGDTGPEDTGPGEGLDLQAAAITVDDLPEGWELSPAQPIAPGTFEESFFVVMEREDGATIRVSLIAESPESIQELRDDVESLREEMFAAETSSAAELIPGATRSVGAYPPGVSDEAIIFDVGRVLATVWVTFPPDAEPGPRAADLAKLVYDRLLKQLP